MIKIWSKNSGKVTPKTNETDQNFLVSTLQNHKFECPKDNQKMVVQPPIYNHDLSKYLTFKNVTQNMTKILVSPHMKPHNIYTKIDTSKIVK